MTTKSPSLIVQFPTDSPEKIAYIIAAEIPVQEPNDSNRLGYCLWGWLKERRGTLLQAIQAAGARSPLTHKEILEMISARLEEKGIRVS
jgi:hypothetical protein